MGETLYSSGLQPDPTSARDVLAFVLTPATAFAPSGDPGELAAVAALLDRAKQEAIQRWYAFQRANHPKTVF